MQSLLAWWLFTVRGWKIKGNYPYHLRKSILVVAPHTHNLDFFLGLAIRKKLHIEFVHFLGKKELFWGIFGVILRKLGGFPVERGKNSNQVDQVVGLYNSRESFHIAISPEGTRKKVTRLKTGFYHIAKNAQIPKRHILIQNPKYSREESTEIFLPKAQCNTWSSQSK
mgnify:CR=1 FL=1